MAIMIEYLQPLKIIFDPQMLQHKKMSILCFWEKAGYKTTYKLALGETNAHINICIFTDAVETLPRTL